MRKRHSPEQIAAALRQAEAGTVAEIIRKLGVHENTFYIWKRRFGGLVTCAGERWSAETVTSQSISDGGQVSRLFGKGGAPRSEMPRQIRARQPPPEGRILTTN